MTTANKELEANAVETLQTAELSLKWRTVVLTIQGFH